MDLAHLERLWILAVLLPVLYLLARPPRPRVRSWTPHLPQWRAALERLGRPPIRFRRLRFWLVVLAGAALVMAATRPRFGTRDGADVCVVVVDGSSSMLAGTAREDAAARVDEVFATLPEHVEVRAVFARRSPVVLDAGERASTRSGLLDLLVDSSSFGDSVELADFARRVRREGAVRVWTITDGLGSQPVPEVGAVSIVGTPRPSNLAVVSCSVADAWPLPFVDVHFEVFAARLQAGDRDRVDVELVVGATDAPSVAADSKTRVVETVHFRETGFGVRAAGEARLRRPEGVRGAVSLRVRLLGVEDGFRADDEVRYLLPALAAPDVALLAVDGAGDGPSPRAVAVAGTLAELGGGRVVASTSPRAGFVVLDGGTIAQLPPRAVLFGTRIASDGGGADGPRMFEPNVRDWARADPLLAGIDLSDLRVREAVRLPDHLEGATVLVEGDQGPLVLAVPRPGGARTVWCAFRLEDANLALLPALPQLLRRAYREAWGEEARVERMRAAASSDAVVDPVAAAESALVPAAGRRERACGPFSDPGTDLTVPLLLLAVLALALRAWV